jgi:ribosomal protein S18 acetylase RimI-like enzyme
MTNYQTSSDGTSVPGNKTASPSGIIFRKAKDGDAAGIATVGADVFRTAFAHSCSKQDMDDFLNSHYTATIILSELHNPARHYFVALTAGDERVVGFSSLATDTSEPCVEKYGDRIELQRIYVDNAHHGKGLAQVLMDMAFGKARELGGRYIWLGVWQDNVKAYRFYNKLGFEKVGEHTFMVGSDEQTDWIVIREL